jgi:23S rRNA (uracil1939-C5)-methyltransferase
LIPRHFPGLLPPPTDESRLQGEPALSHLAPGAGDRTALGAQGDGIAETSTHTRYVAFALPGERVEPSADGLPRLLSAPSPDRVPPVCRHFGICGGCVAQHMGGRLYGEWKRDMVVARCARGLDPAVAPLHHVAPGTRRRAVLTARRAGGSIELGYHRRRTTISSISRSARSWPPRSPATSGAAPSPALAAAEVRMTVLAAPAGLDIALETGSRPAGPQLPSWGGSPPSTAWRA